MALLPMAAVSSRADSELLQQEPIWERKPWKWLYMAYFGLSVGSSFLPYFAIDSTNLKWRARSTCRWQSSTLVRLSRHGKGFTFRTYASLSWDLSQAVPHSSTLRCKFVWILPTPDQDVKRELKRAMGKQ